MTMNCHEIVRCKKLELKSFKFKKINTCLVIRTHWSSQTSSSHKVQNGLSSHIQASPSHLLMSASLFVLSQQSWYLNKLMITLSWRVALFHWLVLLDSNLLCMLCQHMHEQSTNHISLKNRPRCYTKSPTVQDAFRPIPGLISCTGVTGRWGLHRMQSGGWLYSKSGRESTISLCSCSFVWRSYIAIVIVVWHWLVQNQNCWLHATKKAPNGYQTLFLMRGWGLGTRLSLK